MTDKPRRGFFGLFGPDLNEDSKITLWIITCFSLSFMTTLAITENAGSVGDAIGNFIILTLGRGAFLLPLSLFISALILINVQRKVETKQTFSNRIFWGIGLLLWSISAFTNLVMKIDSWGESVNGGGVLGYSLYPGLLQDLFGPQISVIILVTVFLFGFFLLSGMTIIDALNNGAESIKDPGSKVGKLFDRIPDAGEIWKTITSRGSAQVGAELLSPAVSQSAVSAVPMDAKNLMKKLTGSVNKKSTPKPAVKKPEPKEEQVGDIVPLKDKKMKLAKWSFPPFDLLKQNKTKVDPGNVNKNRDIIKNTLANFNIEVEMSEAVIGPTLTQYRLKPADGVRLSAIDKLNRDMALALAATNIRIEAPIPGLGLVGVEVPNAKPSMVRLRDMLQTREFVKSEELTVPIGVDVSGANIFSSITKMPHLLVAGATNSGKSVWINSMLLSLMYKYTPDELQLILIDMKRVELKLYEGVPHLLSSVITDSEKAINALKWAVIEMDSRYQLLEKQGKRNIVDYNTFAKKNDFDDMPYIVLVIDELADLMMLAKAEVEPIVARLTQMSRAVGIHLILGTQRPDTGVVTGLIKANVPSRIAFAVASQVDSRVILDSGGAEKLLGKGDGLFVSPSSIAPVRFQGAFVGEDEVRDCVDFLAAQVEANNIKTNIVTEVTEPPTTKIKIPGFEDQRDSGDETYEQAKRIIVEHQKGSASFLQQMMGIGYPKAAKIIIELEQNGIVGPANGSKPREVYMTADMLG